MTGFRQLHCDDAARRARLLSTPGANGIDYLEVSAASWNAQRFLHVHFLQQPPPTGLIGHPGAFRITGGVRERGLRVLDVTLQGQHLVVEVDRAGDFSTYTLVIDSPALDPAFRAVGFSFKAGCPSRFDCRARRDCPTEEGPEPVIDYMARDYASFRRALLDLVPSLVPDWTDRHEADLGVTLVELMAYAGDYLSYQLDAVSNELHLEGARQRISVRRHARLVDYTMHDGASARTFLHFRVAPGGAGAVPAGTQVFSRIDVPLDRFQPPLGPVLDPDVASLAAATADLVFETVAETRAEQKGGAAVHPELNEIAIHSWGDDECCLPAGATSVDLVGDLAALLPPGGFLLFEEVRGPATGKRADADPTHRQVVRLKSVEAAEDPLSLDPADPGAAPVNLTRVTWAAADALRFPLCLSVRDKNRDLIDGVSVARGNLVLVDHGRVVAEHFEDGLAAPPGDGRRRLADRLLLGQGPLSFRVPLVRSAGDPPPPVTSLQAIDPRAAEPVVELTLDGTPWHPVRHLLESDPFELAFAVETDNRGRASLRFGDGDLGRRPANGLAIDALYRVGVGTGGNVGRDALRHVVFDPTIPGTPALDEVRNPLAAWGGIDAEPIERVKQLAPPAMHAVQYRAVTEEDYARAAEGHLEVSRAVATFRWTGSWYTVFVTVDRVGGGEVDAELETAVRAHLEGSRLAGYDLEVDGPIFVPLEVEIDVCAAPGYFRGHVAQALAEALSSRDLPGGRRGFFHPDSFTFGQTLYLSRLYAAIEAVPGVDSAEVRVFRRWGRLDAGELERGYMSFGRLEIARLDNDPSLPENGVLTLHVRGGK